MASKIKVRNFNINDDQDRAECEEIMTKYGQHGLNRILKHESCFHPKTGMYYVAIIWSEDIPNEEFRD